MHAHGFPIMSPVAARLFALVTLVVTSGVMAGCHESRAQPSADAGTLVRVIHPALSEAGAAQYTGTIRARIESDLGFRVQGKITQRLVDPGQLVHRGQSLMVIDPINLSLAAAAAHQRLAATQADATRAAAEEARQRSLLAEGAISATTYDTGLAAAHATGANALGAKAAARNADLELQYATLTAPADGLVMEVLAQPGQVVAPGTAIVRLAMSGTREALVAIPETAIDHLDKDATAHLYGSDRSYPAHLRELSGAADPITRTFAARYTLDAPIEYASLGATITLTLHKSATRALQVPLAALHDGGHGMGVWVVTPNNQTTFCAVTVQSLGQEDADLAPGALKTSDLIVAMGAHLVREGEKVRVLKDPT